MFSNLQVITISNSAFTGITGNSSAIGVGAVNQLMFDRLQFTNFAGPGVLGCPDATLVRNQFWLYDVTFESITSANVLLESMFTYNSADGMTLTSSTIQTVMAVPQHQGVVTPTIRVLTCKDTQTTSNFFSGLQNRVGYYVIEGSTFKNVTNSYTSFLRLFYPSCHFSGGSGTVSAIGLTPNGPLWLIDSQFENFETGISAHVSNGAIFVCRGTFTNCTIGINIQVQNSEIAASRFTKFDTAIALANGPATVANCAFYDPNSGGVAIGGACWQLWIRGLCCGFTGAAVKLESASQLAEMKNCRFKEADESVAIQVDMKETDQTNEFSASVVCDADTVDVNDVVLCHGYSFSPKPTPKPTEVAIVARRSPARTGDATQLRTTNTPSFTIFLSTLPFKRDFSSQYSRLFFFFHSSDSVLAFRASRIG
jgi:hypothetical protein